MANVKMSSDDRAYFTLVSQAAFTNPFSESRVEIDRKLSGSSTGSLRELLHAVIKKVSSRIAGLDRDNPIKIDDFTGDDRQIIEHVIFFQVYHDFLADFDALIAAQVEAGPQSLPVPFAARAISMLTGRGFSRQAAGRYFSLFYQIRRAFYFIRGSLVGNCAAIRQLRVNLWNNLFTADIRYYEKYMWDKMEDFSTILLGPTGSGKGAAAAAIGRSGFIPYDSRKGCFARSFMDTFIQINLSEFAETLLESELFGHTKGAFTGAVASHTGILALCGEDGAVFLDEIGDTGTKVQIKLLRLLQERVFSPVGSREKLKFKGRVIAATNRDIDEMRQRGVFRDDFFYRLCSDCIFMPSLYERICQDPGELELMTAHTVRRITGHEAPELAGHVIEIIRDKLGMDYQWPGNVRELEQCVRRVILRKDYTGQKSTDDQHALPAELQAGNLNAAELLSLYCKSLYKSHGTYEQVARITELDRRTVKKYIEL
jgi:sigma-54 dependent transcriptional regulator, flagellar regulatory protein